MERCDEAAKSAAQGWTTTETKLPEAIRGKLPISRTATKQEFNAQLKQRAKTIFEKTPRCLKLRRIDATAPSGIFRKITSELPRKHASILVQLRTGHAPLNKHLHMIDRAPSPLCPGCQERNETVHHFLIACEAYEGYRRQILEPYLFNEARSITTLLSNEKAFPHLFRFIQKTKRFEETFGNVELKEKD